eukprot:7825297-Pyramimonas_sp.AAC.1
MARGARGLSLEMQEHFLALGSGNWKYDRVVHYCIGDACPNQRRGDRGRALKGLQDFVVLSRGGKVDAPLLYRVKAFEQAS